MKRSPDLRSNGKKVIAANMKFAPDEAKWFWPTYDQYINELVNINNTKCALIKEYLQNENMTDEQADTLSKSWIDVDASVVQLLLKYVPIFRNASLYPLLYRMESRGWRRASWSETRAGRARRYYRLTAAGQKKLAPLRKQWSELFRALGRLAEAPHA